MVSSPNHRHQEENPLFIHNFWSLRRACLEHMNVKIRKLQARVFGLSSSERDEALDEATRLLSQFDKMVKSATHNMQMQDPHYAASHGVSVVHFTDPSSDTYAEWTMLSRPSGKDSDSLPETDVSLLPKLFQSRIKQFTDCERDTEVYFRRPKTSAEAQPGTVIFHDGTITRRPVMILVWKIAMVFAAVALAVFLGVGIIATNTTFSPTFQRAFFWIALAWIFFSSSLLVWLVRAFGGNKRDMLSALLVVIGIWLVVIQIGQTHLLTQQGGGR